jgi:hypothetical protein
MAAKKQSKSTKPKAPPPPVKVIGTCGGAELDKRQHFPGIVLKSKCPNCGKAWKKDLAGDYLSYPVVGEPTNAYGYCENEKCQHEWPVLVIVQVTIVPAVTP